VKQVPCGNGKKEKQMQMQKQMQIPSLRCGMTKIGLPEWQNCGLWNGKNMAGPKPRHG
jgi:hypothetical protein